MTHKELVICAKQRLSGRFSCNPVFSEQGSARISEMPDAIGWSQCDCYTIECKRTLADLRADQNKPHIQNPSLGMGTYRYYMLTKDLYSEIESNALKYIPNEYGILIANPIRGPRHSSMPQASLEFNSNVKAERDFLRSRVLEIQRFGM